MKTPRGFELQYFKDDYGIECSIQESSAVEPHIWLGIHNPRVKVMVKDMNEITVTKDNPETTEWGWCTVNLPKQALVDSRMHLNQEQARMIVKKLNFFIKNGYLKAE